MRVLVSKHFVKRILMNKFIFKPFFENEKNIYLSKKAMIPELN